MNDAPTFKVLKKKWIINGNVFNLFCLDNCVHPKLFSDKINHDNQETVEIDFQETSNNFCENNKNILSSLRLYEEKLKCKPPSTRIMQHYQFLREKFGYSQCDKIPAWNEYCMCKYKM